MRPIRTIVLGVALVLAVGLNVATITMTSVATVVSSLVSAVTGASTVVSSLRRDASQQGARVVKLTDELDAANLRSAKLADDVMVKDGKIASLTTQLKNPKINYRGVQKPLNEALQDTVGRISLRTKVGSGRNVAAVFGESIPFIGVGVAVAVTGYELKDGCDTLTDLRQLELALNPSAVRSTEAIEVCGTTVPTREEVWAKVKSSPGDAWEGVQSYVPELPDLASLWGAVGETWDGAEAAWQRVFGE